MINRPSKSANPTHYFGAVLKCALLLIFFTLGVEVYAQSYNMSESYRIGGSTQPTLSATQSGCQMADGFRSASPKSYATYQSTVYQPFTTAVPSDDNPVAGFSNEPQITNRKNGFLNPADPDEENRADGSPVGEPWILLLFAAVAAVVVAWRKKEPTPALPEGKE